ncbi:hypothetical protein [Deinococcus sp. PEB2-67]
MTVLEDLTQYDLERYLFGTVHRKFVQDEPVTTFDFFCIVIWKSNRAKSRVAARLMNKNADLDAAVQQLIGDIRCAADNRAKLKVLLHDWQLRLPMATAILTVFYPDDFTIYDFRVCDQVGDFARLGEYSNVDRTCEGYEAFVAAVHAAVPGELSLRDKDRALWGRSFSEQLRLDIQRWAKAGNGENASQDLGSG